MSTVSVRYIVHDVDAAIGFYCQNLGFREEMHPAPTFAILSRGDLRLLLSAPSGRGGGGQAMPDGTRPEPGRLEPHLPRGHRAARDHRGAAQVRGPFPERPRGRGRREPDPAG